MIAVCHSSNNSNSQIHEWSKSKRTNIIKETDMIKETCHQILNNTGTNKMLNINLNFLPLCIGTIRRREGTKQKVTTKCGVFPIAYYMHIAFVIICVLLLCMYAASIGESLPRIWKSVVQENTNLILARATTSREKLIT